MSTKIFTETYVTDIQSETTEFFRGDVDVTVVDPNKIAYWSDNAASIDLDELEEIICDLRQKGANRVEIKYHTDHQCYHFYGTRLDEDLDPKAELALKIKELQSDINTRLRFQKEYKENLVKVGQIIERDTEQLAELLKQYEAK